MEKRTEMKLMEKHIELKELNNRYGWRSCLNFPKEYERMDELAQEIKELTKELLKEMKYNSKCCEDDIHEIYSQLLERHENGELPKRYEIYIYSLDGFIEDVIEHYLNGDELKMFRKLEGYIDDYDLGRWVCDYYVDDADNMLVNSKMTCFGVIY